MFDYQIDGFSYMVDKLKTRKGVINGCEVGLGKTLQTISTLEHLDLYPCLIYSPKAVVPNWEKEFSKFLTSKKEIQIVESTKEIEPNKDVYLVNFRHSETLREKFLSMDFKCLILDESQYAKSFSSKEWGS